MNLDKLLKKAKSGDPQAQYDLADLYEYGSEDGSIAPDDDIALKWYDALAEQDYPEGILGSTRMLKRKNHKVSNQIAIQQSLDDLLPNVPGYNLYNEALSYEKDGNYEKAIDLLFDAGAAGCAMAYFRLAKYYGSETFAPYDFAKELAYCEIAAEAGLKEAMLSVALCYEQGDKGQVIDIDKAIDWYTALIKTGDTSAQKHLERALQTKEELLQLEDEDYDEDYDED